MPVNLLYCEGGAKSPDIRIILAVLAGACMIEPAGEKYGLGQRVRLSRDTRPNSTVAGLRDRDFDKDDSVPTYSPREWRVEGGRVWIGWFWERVEVENYLIDPSVVQRALGNKAPEAGAYRSALLTSAEAVADYTAARTALSVSRVRFSPMDNAWGKEKGSDKHKFPDERGETDCRKGINEVVKEYARTQVVQEGAVLHEFDTLLPACRPNGQRFKHFIAFFSGKDLLYGMEDALTGLGFKSPFEFRERILKGIENSSEDVWTWLPEWTQLRKLVMTPPS